MRKFLCWKNNHPNSHYLISTNFQAETQQYTTFNTQSGKLVQCIKINTIFLER